MPSSAIPIKVERVASEIFLWAIIDPESSPSLTTISFVGTGWDLPDSVRTYLGTVFDLDGLVWHIFSSRAF